MEFSFPIPLLPASLPVTHTGARQILQRCLKRLRLEAGFEMDQLEKAEFAGCHVEREVRDDTGRDVALNSSPWSRRKAFYQSWSMPGRI